MKHATERVREIEKHLLLGRVGWWRSLLEDRRDITDNLTSN